MTIVALTRDRLHALLQYDPNTGKFHHTLKRPGVKHPNRMAGCMNKSLGYVVIRLDKRLYYAHRLAWLYVYGEWPADEIDHINGDKTDNRVINLRVVDRKTNQQNLRVAIRHNDTGFLGVHFSKQKGLYQSGIRDANGKSIVLGFFATPEEAHASYLTAKRLLHAGCTI